jgi:hypothetical protein
MADASTNHSHSHHSPRQAVSVRAAFGVCTGAVPSAVSVALIRECVTTRRGAVSWGSKRSKQHYRWSFEQVFDTLL